MVLRLLPSPGLEDEFLVVAALVLVTFHDIARPLSADAYLTDSSDEGFAAQHGTFPASAWRCALHWNEWWRFWKVVGPNEVLVSLQLHVAALSGRLRHPCGVSEMCVFVPD